MDFELSDDRADLIAERIDVAFRGGPMQDTGYVGRQVLANPGDGMAASPAYLAACGTPTTLQGLEAHDCVTFSHPSGRVTWRLSRPDGLDDEVQVSLRFSGNTAQALRKAALAGLGIALLPNGICLADLQAGLLVPVLSQYKCTGHGLNVLYPCRRHLPPAVSAFIELAIDKLRAWDEPYAVRRA